MQTIISIPGIHCNSCATLIKDVSSEFPSIQNVNVDIEGKKVTLEHSGELDIKKWVEEIESLGDTYQVQSTS